MLAFDKQTDALAADVIYHVGKQNPPMELEAGKEYKFVAVCFNIIPQEMPEYTPAEPYFFIPKIEYVNPNKPVLAGARVVSVSAGLIGQDSLLHLPYMASHIPLSFFRIDNYPALSATNVNYLDIVFKQLFCQVNLTVDLSSSIYTSYVERLSFNDSKIIKGLDLKFSLQDASLLGYSTVPDWSFKLMSNKYHFYLTENTNSGQCLVNLILRNDMKEEVRNLTINNLEFKKGYRYILKLRVLPGSEVPVGATINLTEQKGFDREEEVLR